MIPSTSVKRVEFECRVPQKVTTTLGTRNNKIKLQQQWSLSEGHGARMGDFFSLFFGVTGATPWLLTSFLEGGSGC
jgi:hypothetical protein